jgi:hypothetical protein
MKCTILTREKAARLDIESDRSKEKICGAEPLRGAIERKPHNRLAHDGIDVASGRVDR